MKSNQLALLSPEGIKRLTEVTEWLEAGAPHKTIGGAVIEAFEMDVGVTLDPECGTACCIAGAVCQFSQPFKLSDGLGEQQNEVNWRGEDGVMARALSLLGLNRCSEGLRLAHRIFRANDDNDHITAEIAARAMRHFLNTGELEWPEAPEEEEPDHELLDNQTPL